jgi:hypothetical protein
LNIGLHERHVIKKNAMAFFRAAAQKLQVLFEALNWKEAEVGSIQLPIHSKSQQAL